MLLLGCDLLQRQMHSAYRVCDGHFLLGSKVRH